MSYVSCNIFVRQCKWDPIAHFDENVARYIALKDLKMVESDRKNVVISHDIHVRHLVKRVSIFN